MRAVLICNGSVSSKLLHKNISSSDFIVAVDGGANKLVKTKFRPDIIIGDMDSINSRARAAFKNVKMLSYPREKDMVDLELALNYCIEKKSSEILILGAVGSRVDMTLTGFKYEIRNFSLRFGIGLGLSNEFKDKKAKVSFSEGPLVCVHFRKY